MMCPVDTIREHIYAEKLRQLRQQLVCRNGDRHSLALAVPISVSGKPNVAHATRIVHSSRPFALRDFLQANISTVMRNQILLSVLASASALLAQ
jgi:pyrroline-5-carboxylate reductase